MKKISRFEYFFFQGLGREDLIEGCEPKTWAERQGERERHIKEVVGNLKTTQTNSEAG